MSVYSHFRYPLTKRQLQLIAMAAQGQTIASIAEELHITTGTAQAILDRARESTDARNITHLVALCLAAGFIKYEDD